MVVYYTYSSALNIFLKSLYEYKRSFLRTIFMAFNILFYKQQFNEYNS